ncbi:MAG TPA: 1-acyl-sn-glycerol-3-phosphate acyltransferase [Candidatus Avipropionibacterium avicola]|uniref:1-acyl-sn-glycerol-3-phosphate acyltransferase n=1 Tax=Candidatus Avipropionibacterium avicola TaxID=2840701 RepID=A0A9D1H1Z8_9ACTN|nr:1-acyl-sn-glycerol-3-phosphate acyltransferase [Candidatus Avipropionibacterium avicola]
MYQFCRRLVALWLRIMVRPVQVDAERMPMTGAAIIAPNHGSAIETVMVPAVIPRKLGHVAKRELFTSRNPFMRLLGWFIHWAGARPMDRSGGRASATSIAGIVDHVRNGGAAVVFPEGTRSPDGRLYKGKTGVARLALASGAPVIPVGIVNNQPRKVKWWPVPIVWRPEVRWGEPIDFSQWQAGIDDRAVLRHVTDQVMAAIQDLTGQQYVDVYAASLRSALAEGREINAVEQDRPGQDNPVPTIRQRPTQDDLNQIDPTQDQEGQDGR